MAYSKFTSDKTVTVESAAGSTTLIYYAGNEDESGNVEGNANKRDISYKSNPSITWITDITISDKDSTAKNIKVTYKENTGTSSRTAKLKLEGSNSNYVINFTQKAPTVTTEPENITIKIQISATIENMEASACLLLNEQLSIETLNAGTVPGGNSGCDWVIREGVSDYKWVVHNVTSAQCPVYNTSGNIVYVTPGNQVYVYFYCGEEGMANNKWREASSYQFNGSEATWQVGYISGWGM